MVISGPARGFALTAGTVTVQGPISASAADIAPKSLPRDVDVLIVGFGPVGAACANVLGRYGIRTAVIDRFPEILKHPRAIALDSDALRILQGTGLSETDFETVAIPHVDMHSPVWGRFGRIDTAGTADGHPKLVTFFQPDLEHALRKHAAGCESLHLHLGAELIALQQDENTVLAELRTEAGHETVRCRYLIGADGAHSTVRHLIGLDFTGKSYDEDWLIVDALRSPTGIDHVEFICDPRRPTPHMVSPGGRERWEFMLRPGEAKRLQDRPELMDDILSKWSKDGGPLQIERKAVYRFQARVARSFSNGRVFLVGDAAHVTPPFVGQGLVSGLRDCANLCWKLAWVLNGRAAPEILESYTAERKPHATAMIRMALIMGRLVMPRNLVLAFFLHGLARGLQSGRGARRAVKPEKIRPPSRFRKGLLAPKSQMNAGLAGATLPQGWLRNAQGEVRLSDDAMGPHMKLIGFGVDPSSCFDMTDPRLAAMDARPVLLLHRGQVPSRNSQTPHWEDLHGAIVPDAVPFGWVAIVRPDHTIIQAGPASSAEKILDDTATILGLALLTAPLAAAESGS